MTDPLATYNSCPELGHVWRQIRVTLADGVVRQLLTCDRCLAKSARNISAATGELISETTQEGIPE